MDDNYWKDKLINEFGSDYVNSMPEAFQSYLEYYNFLTKYGDFIPFNMGFTPQQEYDITRAKHISPYKGAQQYYSPRILLEWSIERNNSELVQYFIDLYEKKVNDLSDLLFLFGKSVILDLDYTFIKMFMQLLEEYIQVNQDVSYKDILAAIGSLGKKQIYKDVVSILRKYNDIPDDIVRLFYYNEDEEETESSSEEESENITAEDFNLAEYYRTNYFFEKKSDPEEEVLREYYRTISLKRFIEDNSYVLEKLTYTESDYGIELLLEQDRYDIIVYVTDNISNSNEPFLYDLAATALRMGYYFILEAINIVAPDIILKLV